MSNRQVLNLNSNHKVDYSVIEKETVIEVFTKNLSPDQYKDAEVLKKICCDKIKSLNLDDKEVHVIYSGLAVVLMAFVDCLKYCGHTNVKVLFEDKDNGGYYMWEVNGNVFNK